MSITDELREFIDSLACHKDTRDMMRRIADRIDAEHAEAVADALQLRGEPDRWVELPVDADGVPIRVGDELRFQDDQTLAKASYIGLTCDGWVIEDDSLVHEHNPCDCYHVQPDSWVRIIGDAMSFEGDGWYSTRDDAMAELVERCRRLAGGGA